MTKLSATSALVQLWAQQDCYQTKPARQYLSQLDLDEGRILHEQCRTVWPYYDEVIKNRKFGVAHLIGQCCSEKIEGQQLVIAGAGLDALGIETAERYAHVSVFELDRVNMDLKALLAADINMDSRQRLHFIEIYITDSVFLRKRLVENGWDPQTPTLLVLEGISYYLPEESIRKMAHIIRPKWIVFEFLKEEWEISAERAEIPRKVFDIIADRCGSPCIERYDYPTVERLFDMPVTSRHSMKQLENMRTGANRIFPTAESGWIEVCLLADP